MTHCVAVKVEVEPFLSVGGGITVEWQEGRVEAKGKGFGALPGWGLGPPFTEGDREGTPLAPGRYCLPIRREYAVDRRAHR